MDAGPVSKKGYNPSANSARTITPPFPTARFSLAICILIVGVAVGLYQTTVASLNPDPLTGGFKPLSPQTWLYPLERHGVLRIPLVDTASAISRVAIKDNSLAIEFDSQQQILLSPTGEFSNITNQSNEGTQTQSVVANIIIELDNLELSESNKRQISAIFATNKIVKNSQGAWPPITLYGYVSGLQQKIQQQSQNSLSQFTNGGKAEPQKQSKRPEQQTAQLVNSQLPVSERTVEELAKQTSKDLTQMVAEYMSDVSDSDILSDIELIGYGFQQHYDGRWLPGAGTRSGVVVSIFQTIDNLNWQTLPSDEIVPADGSNNWRISNGVLQYGFANRYTTIAIFPSALNAIYSDTENYKSLAAQRYPTPFALLIMLLATLVAVRVIALGKVEDDLDVVERQDLVDSFVSDAPISEADQDKLGFREISRALSRFMRNASTKAPLTLAITGVWGSGKSSLMYFLRQSLEQHHLKPVWVNAWHHQNEEQFLAGLLSAIQRNAVPPFWSAAGTLYRWNLLKMRWTEAPVFFFLALIVFLTSLGYLLSSGQPITPEITKLKENAVPYVGALVGAFSIVRGGMDRLSGMVNENYISSLLRFSSRNLDLRANVGLREKFAREFKMLCNALGDSTLTIFIDDLDRCKESRIMDVMETINYLVSSGDCFIVVGMEREPVEKAIASYYRQTHSSLDDAELMVKAKRYLEKIVNIEIPVPTGNSDQFAGLVQEYKAPNKSRRSYAWVKPVCFALACIASVFLGSYLSPEGPEIKPVATVEESQSQNPKLKDPIPLSENPEPASESLPSLTLLERELVVYDYRMTIPFFLIAFIAVVIRVERYRQRKHIVENDSQPFLQAIATWATLMGKVNKTPRSIKRYVNRTRYLAMRNIESKANIKDENIVTLAALLEFVKDDELAPIDSLAKYLPEVENAELAKQIQDLIETSKSVTPTKALNFEHWIRGVNIN